MGALPEPIERASAIFDSLPGLGPRASLRYVSWLAAQPKEVILTFAKAIEHLAQGLKQCSICHQWADASVCRICRDPLRDTHTLCVVATSQDIRPMEESGAFKGRYHVLGGTLDPLEGRGAATLSVPSLLSRLEKTPTITEALIALDADMTGDATTLYLEQQLARFPHVRLTRLARGLPTGASLEYADPLTLIEAIQHRRSTERKTPPT